MALTLAPTFQTPCRYRSPVCSLDHLVAVDDAKSHAACRLIILRLSDLVSGQPMIRSCPAFTVRPIYCPVLRYPMKAIVLHNSSEGHLGRSYAFLV